MPDIEIRSNHPRHGKPGKHALWLGYKAWGVLSSLGYDDTAVVGQCHVISEDKYGNEQIYFRVHSSPKDERDFPPEEMLEIVKELKHYAETEFDGFDGFYELEYKAGYPVFVENPSDPEGYELIKTSDSVPHAFMWSETKKIVIWLNNGAWTVVDANIGDMKNAELSASAYINNELS
ncbi:unnamed protein product [marine sediment metagenome]|uniref:Uncharacterized protein n=1 Tax=marine sediment metagenome TaxID=412755 RepID=X0XB00_9ZZZZ